jgi:hypothetical protein
MNDHKMNRWTPPPIPQTDPIITITPNRFGFDIDVSMDSIHLPAPMWAFTEKGALRKGSREARRRLAERARRNRAERITVTSTDYTGPYVADENGYRYTPDGRHIIPTGPTPKGGAR